MSGNPVVPSRDALRALRTLAFSTSAAFVGAAGTLCGVATIHYHERSKVCQAERILETKRKLHSITQGRGSARVALMFEAAEKGEDFTIKRGQKKRISKRRHYSTLAARNEAEGGPQWRPFVNGLENTTSDAVQPDLQVDLSKPLQVTIAGGKQFYPYKDAAQNGWPVRGSAVSKRIKGSHTNKQHAQPETPTDWSFMVNARLDKLRAKRYEIARSLMQSETEELLNHAAETQVVQHTTDLSPLASSDGGRPEQLQVGGQESIDVSESILLKIESLTSASNNAFSSLQPWNYSLGDKVDEPRDLEERHHTAKDLNLYLSSSSPVPFIEVRHDYKSRYNFDQPRVRQGMSLAGVDRYIYVFTSLMNYRNQYGNQKALLLLEEIMDLYTRTNKPSDWALVQALFLDCTKLFPTSDLKPHVWRFVRKFLAGDMPRLEVVSLLYPNCGAGNSQKQQHYYFLAHQYLEAIREHEHRLEHQVTELRKVLAGTRMLDIEPHEHLMVPALRSYCAAGRMSSAQALFDEMVTHHKINATFYSLQILIKGYAQANNWGKVKLMLEKYRTQTTFKDKVYGISGLFGSIINRYSSTHPPEKVVEFTRHCIEHFGVQPVSGITREIIGICLRDRRYDLIKSWLSILYTKFPSISTGTMSATFAFDISCIWKNMDASCEDILHGCRAIAAQSLRDPFSNVFRASVSEAAIRYISSRLQELKYELGHEAPDFLKGEIYNIQNMFESLQKYASFPRGGPRTKLLISDLLRQGEALRRLNTLCSGQLEMSHFNVSRTSAYNSAHSVKYKVMSPQLPPVSKVQDILRKEYKSREKDMLLPEHDSLRNSVTQLVQQNRPNDAYDLIQSIYDSQWAQPPRGKEFDLDLFTEWLQLAWKLRSGTKLRYVLWAILDAGPQLKLSSQIVLLARIAAPKTHFQRVKNARQNEIEEIEYLRLRLRRRHWSSSTQEPLRFDEWTGLKSYER